MKIAEVMTSDVMTCRRDDTLADCATMMKELNVGVAPVVDEDENLIGVITDRDIAIRAVAKGADPKTEAIGGFMSPSPITIEPDTNVEDAAAIMADAQVRRLPVVQDGKMVGIVSLGDLAVDVGETGMLAEALERISTPVR